MKPLQEKPVQESLAIRWYGDHLDLLDQRLLPLQEHWLHCTHVEQVTEAITAMAVRGAPAIGIVAAYGLALAARQQGAKASASSLLPALESLANSRPTAVNLFWALERLRPLCEQHQGEALCAHLASEAVAIHEQDRQMNVALAGHGAPLLPKGSWVYTHCNTGSLATGGHGTALGIIRTAWLQKRIQGVYAGETRPWLQGSRLTTWELMQDGIDTRLVVDSAAGHLMANGKIGAVITGADRITAQGDTANKIGTYTLAILARHHGLPFIVAAPSSTIDLELTDGSAIPIEQRPGEEITTLQGVTIAPENTIAENPAFDITPAELISAIVTERGVIRAPDRSGLQVHITP